MICEYTAGHIGAGEGAEGEDGPKKLDTARGKQLGRQRAQRALIFIPSLMAAGCSPTGFSCTGSILCAAEVVRHTCGLG